MMETRSSTETAAMVSSSYEENTYFINVLSGLPEGEPQGSFMTRVSVNAKVNDLLRLVCHQAQVPLCTTYRLQTADGELLSMNRDLASIQCVQEGKVLTWVSTAYPSGSKNGKCWSSYWLLGILSLLFAVAGLTTVIYVQLHEEQNFQYAVIFDAGSSHTSMFIYKWEGEKINSTAVAIQDGSKCSSHSGGISSFANNASGAGKSLVDCLNKATDRIPTDKKSSTSVYLGATAGMRLLNKENHTASDAVLKSVRDTISSYHFKFVDPQRQARIIPGSEEGAFSWITSNYVTGTFDVHPPTDEIVPEMYVSSVGTLDLGGASTQITFIPNKTEGIPEVDHFLTDLYGTNYSLYTHSYLCYGVNEAIRRLEAVLIEAANFSSSVDNPCSPKGNMVNVTHGDIFGSACVDGEDAVLHYGHAILSSDDMDKATVYSLHGGSNATACRTLVTSALFNFSAHCPYDRCSFNGVYQPPVYGDFYGISSYFYVMEFLNLTKSDAVNYTDFSAAIKSLCAKDWQEVKHMKTEAPQNLPWYCFESIYVDTILVQGYGFDPNSTWNGIHFVESIGGVDVGWSLGFVINESNQLPATHVQHTFSDVGLALLIVLFCLFFIVAVLFAVCACRRCRSPKNGFYAETNGYGAI